MTTRPPVSLPKSIGRRPAADEHDRLSVTRSDSPDVRASIRRRLVAMLTGEVYH